MKKTVINVSIIGIKSVSVPKDIETGHIYDPNRRKSILLCSPRLLADHHTAEVCGVGWDQMAHQHPTVVQETAAHAQFKKLINKQIKNKY